MINNSMELSNLVNQLKQNKIIKFKHLKFNNERVEILHIILNILEINDQNNIFYSHDLDINAQKQQNILALMDNIQQYFMVSKWPAFKTGNESLQRKYISIVKSVLNEMGVKMESLSIKKKYNNRTINTTAYKIDMATIPKLT